MGNWHTHTKVYQNIFCSVKHVRTLSQLKLKLCSSFE